MMREFFKTEFGKLREMSFKEKRQYIWEYYKLHIFGIAILIFIIGSLLNIWVFNPPKQEYIYIGWMSPTSDPFHPELLGESLSIIVENPDRQRVGIASYALTGNQQMDMAIQTRFFATMQTAGFDAFLLTREALEEIAPEGFVRPIHEVISYTTMDFSDRIVVGTYISVHDGIERTDAIAVSLRNSLLLNELGIESDNLYFAVVSNAQNFYRIAKALEVIFS